MEEALEETEARLEQWTAEIDHIAAKTQMPGVQASFEALMYVDELKALHAIAQSEFDEFRAAAATATEGARLKAEMRSALKELEAIHGQREKDNKEKTTMNNTRMVLIAAALVGALGPARAPADTADKVLSEPDTQDLSGPETQVVSGPETKIGFRGWGPRVGLSLNYDQVHFGAHLDYGQFVNHVRLQPNLELGFGDGVKLFTINAEAAYRFSSTWDVWSPYLGGGIGANIKSVDNEEENTTQTDLGVNLLGGIEKGLANGDRFFVEAKVSVNDVPDAKIAIGWTFFH